MFNKFTMQEIRLIKIISLVLLQFNFVILAQQTLPSNAVYSPFYLNKIDFVEDSGVPLKIKVASEVDLVFIATGFNGILVMDKLGKEKLLTASFNNQYINSFDVTSNGRYLMFGLKGKVSIYEFINPLNKPNQSQQFVEIGSSSFPTEVQDIVYLDILKIAVVVGMAGEVVVYDVTNMSSISVLANYNTQSIQITGVSTLSDGQWIYLGCDIVGVVVLKLKITASNSQANERQGQLLLGAKGIGYRKSWSVIVTNDYQFIFEIENWFGLFYAPFQHVVTSDEGQYPIELVFKPFWPFTSVSPICFVLMVSSDDKLLFVGARSQGIFVFDISQPDNFRFYQQIQVDALAISAAFSKDEQQLYYSNSLSLFTFSRNKPNLNNEYPNIFNSHQAIQNEMEGIYKWRCYIDPTNNYLIGAFDYSGFYFIPFFQDPYRLNPQKAIRLNIETDSAQMDPSGKYLYIPSLYAKKLITVLQVKPGDDDPQNTQNISLTTPKEVYSFNIDSIYMSEQLIFSKDRQYAIVTYSTGLLFFDTSDPLKFELIQYWINPAFMHGENQGVIITNDNKWIVSTIRSYGVYSLDASDKKNFVLADYIETRGGEGIELSKINEQYAYLMDGMKGLAIIDLKYLPKINIISRVSLPGWTQVIQPLFNDKYMLVSSMENGMLTLLNISDKKNPRKISTYRRDKQYTVSICLSNDFQYVFIANPQGIISLPLFSKIMIHTEVNELITISGNNTTVKFDQKNSLQNVSGLSENDYVFKVGQTIQFSFVILYPEDDMRISAVSIYDNNQVLHLPNYMVYDFSLQTLVMRIDRLLLGEEKDKVQLSTILIQTVIPLSANSFVYTPYDQNDKAITTFNQAKLIINYLQEINVLDEKNTLISSFNPNKQQIFDEEFIKNKLLSNVPPLDLEQISQEITKKVKITLIKSSFVNPVIFYIQPSLSFDINRKVSQINSLSKTVVIEIQSNEKDGIFVLQEYQGIISSTSETFDYIRLEGQLDGINRILQSKIIFSNKTKINMNDSKNSTEVVQIIISDSINFPITFNQPINRCNFITLKEQLQLNPNMSLQQQVNRIYPDSVVYIESEFSITFADNSFIASDAQVIKYQIQYNTIDEDDEGSYENLPADFWMQSEGETKFSYHGTIPSSHYLNVYHFKVNATDGHTNCIGKFTLKVYGVPFSYIFNLLLKILGPLFAVLGIYRKRFIILNMIFKNSVQFDDEVIECNQKFCKRIILLGNNVLQDSKILTNLLFAKIEEEYSKKGKQFTNNEIPQSAPSLTDLNHPYGQKVTFDHSTVIKKIQQEKLRTPSKAPQMSSIKKTINNIKAQKMHVANSVIEKLYLKQNGNISMTKIIKDLISCNFTNTHKQTLSVSHNYAADLKNVNSRIYRGIRAQSARYLLQLDKRSSIVYESIKNFCYRQMHQSLNGWYKAIISIDEMQETDQNGILITFPQLSIITENMMKILIQLKLFQQADLETINNYTKIIRESKNRILNINFFLIRQVLFADALGFSPFIPSVLQPAIGESIHLNSHEIKQILAFKKGNYKKCTSSIMKFFNLEYNKYGVSKNLRLPSWLQLDQKHGVLIFYGIPSTEDIDEVLIRIYDVSGYVIKQFILKVQDSSTKPIQKQNEDSNFSIPNENDIEMASFQQRSHQVSYVSNSRTPKERREKYFQKNFKQRSMISPELNWSKQYSDASFDTINLQQVPFSKHKGKEPNSIQLYEFSKNDNNKNMIEELMNESKSAKISITIDTNTQHENNDFIYERTLPNETQNQQNETPSNFVSQHHHMNNSKDM